MFDVSHIKFIFFRQSARISAPQHGVAYIMCMNCQSKRQRNRYRKRRPKTVTDMLFAWPMSKRNHKIFSVHTQTCRSFSKCFCPDFFFHSPASLNICMYVQVHTKVYIILLMVGTHLPFVLCIYCLLTQYIFLKTFFFTANHIHKFKKFTIKI